MNSYVASVIGMSRLTNGSNSVYLNVLTECVSRYHPRPTIFSPVYDPLDVQECQWVDQRHGVLVLRWGNLWFFGGRPHL